MPQKRLRIFAGPNGSGKSSLLKIIPASLPLGYYINADEIEKLIFKGKGIKLSTFGIHTSTESLHHFFESSSFANNKSNAVDLKRAFSIRENIVQIIDGIVSPKYSAAILAEFLREENLRGGNDFSFETVMSHKNKIDFIRKANRSAYHVYLYFICTDDVRVNIERVKTRVIEKGHPVPEGKIKTRYFRTLDLLNDALKLCYKSYLFDNSNKTIEVARIDRDKTLKPSTTEFPNWFITYVLNKQSSE